MRKVDRKSVQVPVDVLDRLDPRTGLTERQAAVAYYEPLLPAGVRIKSYDFQVYGDPKIREVLNELFQSKCAYCEIDFAASHPMEVEHYRPKGEVKIRNAARGKWFHGYYWLASDWENLLASCIDCNRERGHIDESGRKFMGGKKNWFPVADERKRWRSHNRPCNETPLLLNPCLDDPAIYFRFDDEGRVVARPEAGLDRARALASIEIYALNRPELVRVRRRHAREMQRLFATILSLTRQHLACRQAGYTGLLKDLESTILVTIADLKTRADKAGRFSEMSRQLLAGFESKIQAL